MKFIEIIIIILRKAKRPLTPQEIRKEIKENYPQFYGTDSHRSNVEKGHYKDLDHALLAQIYSTVKQSNKFNCDKSFKPMKVTLRKNVGENTSKPSRPKNGNKVKNEDALISNIEYYYKRSLEVLNDFGGPSISFHVQAIKEQENNFLSDRHIEMIYATLASWGMHKMGNPNKTKAKLVSFTDFKKSILTHREELKKLLLCEMHSCNYNQYATHIDELKNIYYSLKVSIAEATIVAHSKTLAHILPNLVPPLDRQYTVRFFTQEYHNFFSDKGKFKPVINLPYGKGAQFNDFKDYCCRIKAMFDRCDKSIFSINKDTFNTSYPKIMDNCIVAFVKDAARP